MLLHTQVCVHQVNRVLPVKGIYVLGTWNGTIQYEQVIPQGKYLEIAMHSIAHTSRFL